MARSPLLESRDGRLLLAGQAISFLAHGISAVALPWLVLDASGSKTAAGLVFTFSVLPYVLFGIPAGVVGDRYPSRVVIWMTHAIQAMIALVVPLWSFAGTPPVAIVLVAAFAIGTGRVFSDAGVFGALVSIVGKDRIVHGQATLGAAWAVGLLAGPALGGLLITTIGPAKSLVVEAAGLGIAALLIRLVRFRPPSEDRPRSPARQIVRDGLQTIFGDQVLRTVTFLGAAWSIAEAGSWALAVPLFRDELGLSSGQAGAVLAAGAAMGILASPIVGALDARIGALRIIVLGYPIAAVSIAVLGRLDRVRAGARRLLRDGALDDRGDGRLHRRAPATRVDPSAVDGRNLRADDHHGLARSGIGDRKQPRRRGLAPLGLRRHGRPDARGLGRRNAAAPAVRAAAGSTCDRLSAPPAGRAAPARTGPATLKNPFQNEALCRWNVLCTHAAASSVAPIPLRYWRDCVLARPGSRESQQHAGSWTDP